MSVIIVTHNRKDKLLRLLSSLHRVEYPKDKIEIIVVDDASSDGTYEEVRKRFPRVKIIRNSHELLPSAARNVGIKKTSGRYIFIIDDDNVVDRKCILELVKTLENNKEVGIVAPIMYYLKNPRRIWCAGIRRNMITSLTKYIGRDEIDVGQYNGLIESQDFPNAFMIRRQILEKIGLFDARNFPIHYEEADLGARVRLAGYKIVCNPRAKIWHDIPLPEEISDKARLFHCHNELRAYFCGRNRIIFHRKYSKKWQFLQFILIFNWIISLIYIGIIIFGSEKSMSERIRIIKAYLRGILDAFQGK